MLNAWSSLCADVKFNVIVFGSNWQFMSDACQDYTEESAAAAVAWVQTNVHANWGGTEIGGTLDAIYKTPLCDGVQRAACPLARTQCGLRRASWREASRNAVLHSGTDILLTTGLNMQCSETLLS